MKNESPITNISRDERRIARYLNIHPDHIEDFLIIINNLLHIETTEGKSEMMKEISIMMSPK